MKALFHLRDSGRRLGAWGLTGLVGLSLVACNRTPPAEEPIRAVKTITVGLEGAGASSEYSGEVRARVESRLGFRVGGKITRRALELGQRVRAGQVLAQLDAQDFRLAADAARAQVSAAQTQRDLAAADFKRYRELKEQNFISGAELERREATLKGAQATLEQAQAQLSAQGNQAAYTQLVADAAGVVTAVEAEVGQVVSPGAVVVRVAQDGPRDVVFSVPEDQVALMKPGLPFQVRGWSGGEVRKAALREVAASADPVTRTFLVKVGLGPRDPWPLGATVYAGVPSPAAAAPRLMKLPTSALRQDGARTAVWLLDPQTMTVRSQPIEIATADQNEVVVAAGLQPGQQVVSTGVHVLAQGQKVTLYRPPASSASLPASAGAARAAASAPASSASR